MADKYINTSECEKYFYEHLDDNGMIGAMNAIDEMPAAEVRKIADIKDYVAQELRSFERSRDAARRRAETNKTMQECYNEFAYVLKDILTLLEKED